MLRRYVLFGLLLAAALLARVALVANKQSVEHDEAISYMAATGHLGDYARVLETGQFPYNQWASAHAWQQFTQPDKPLTYEFLATELAHYHPHPPLYFVLLRLWIRLFGVTVWSGPLLNVLIDVGTGFALYRLARGSFAVDRTLAVVALWALSTVSLLTMIVARPYSLFALLTVLYALTIRRFSLPPLGTKNEPQRRKGRGGFLGSIDGNIRSLERIWILRAASLVLIGAAGLLTHFYFFLALAAGGTIVWTQHDRSRLVEFGLCTMLSSGIFAALHPHFLISVRNNVTGQFAWAAFPDRLTATVGALALLSIPVAAALVLPLASIIVRRGRERDQSAERVSGFQSEIFLAWLLGGQIVLYLLQISLKHALMDYRYFGPAWPFAALVMVRALNSPFLARLACVGTLALAGIVTWPDAPHYARPEPGTRILIDNPARGVLLPVVMQLDGDTPVFAADQADLLAEPDRWLPALRRDGGLYSYLPLYTATDSGHAAILNLIGAAAEVAPAPEPFIWQADFHRDQEQVTWIVKK